MEQIMTDNIYPDRGPIDQDLFNQVFVREDGKNINKPQLKQAVTFGDDPDEKLYLLLLIDQEDAVNQASWEIKIGRQTTFDYLKNLISAGAIDQDMSFILSGSQNAEKAITIYRFMRMCIDNGYVLLSNIEEFDPDDYHNQYTQDGSDYQLKDIGEYLESLY